MMKFTKNTEHELAPAGNQLAICNLVVDLGDQVKFHGSNEVSRKVWIGWEIHGDKLMEDGRPYQVGREYTFSSYENAWLMRHLVSWRGRPFTGDQLAEFEIQAVLGTSCLVNVIHEAKRSSDGHYAKVESISQVPGGMKLAKQVNASVYFSFDDCGQGEFDRVPAWLRNRASSSPQFRSSGLVNGESGSTEPAKSEDPGSSEPVDDGIPF